MRGRPCVRRINYTHEEGWIVKERVMRYGEKANRPRNHFDRVSCNVRVAINVFNVVDLKRENLNGIFQLILNHQKKKDQIIVKDV